MSRLSEVRPPGITPRWTSSKSGTPARVLLSWEFPATSSAIRWVSPLGFFLHFFGEKTRSLSHSIVYFVFKLVSWFFFFVTSVVIYSKTTLVHFQVCQQYTSKQAFFMSKSTLVRSVSIYRHSWFINPRVFCKTASTRKWWRRYSGGKNFKQLNWTC